MFLTADHAGAENVTYLKDNKYKVDNINYKNVESDLKEFSKATFGEDLILSYSSFNVFFDKDLIKAKGLELSKVKQAFKDFLIPKICETCFTEEEILASSGTDDLIDFVANGYDPTQNGELYFIYNQVISNIWQLELRMVLIVMIHVPLLFYGWNIKKGESHDKKVITQIAPTVSQLLKITMPNSTKSEVLTEVFTKK